MSPSRNNPNADSSGRRPRVAGLRKPGESPRPTPRPRPEPQNEAESPQDEAETSAQQPEQPAQAEPAPQPETESARTETDSGTRAEADVGDRGTADVTEPIEATEGAGATEGAEGSTNESDEPVGEEAAEKPSPRRKPRRAGTDKPAEERDLTDAAEPGTPPARLSGARPGKKKQPRSRKRSYFLAAGLVILAAVFATGAVFAKIGYSNISSTTDNGALLEVNRTQEVKKAMKSAAERLFSVDYRHIDKTEKAAKELLASKDVENTYTTLMGEVKRLAPKQKIVVTVNATEAAVVRLEDDKARVMVYVDQVSKRSEKKKAARAGAALWFQTELRDGEWKVVGMDTYSSGQPVGNGQKQQGKPQQQDKQQDKQQQDGTTESSSSSSTSSSDASAGN